jgi:O-antigen ligase
VIACAVWAYVGWVFFHTSVITRAYNPGGLFDPLFLLCGFTIARTLDQQQRERSLSAIAILLVFLSFWALGQLAFGAGRGHAHFETGNTLASVLNIALAPAIVCLAYGVKDRRLEFFTVVLFAGLVATLSRGGAIALVGGLMVTVVILGVRGMRASQLGKVALLLLAGAASMVIAGALSKWLPHLAGEAPVFSNLDSVKSRLELYRLAWSTTSFGLGIGYLAFRYVLEVGRADVPSYGETSFTYFVHNDYLQALLELGVPGFILMVFLVVAAFLAATRAACNENGTRVGPAAWLAGALTMAIHALVDFPFHAPMCLALFGLALGLIDDCGASPAAPPAPASQLRRVAMLLAGMALTVMLARTVTAEAAANYGMTKWLLGEPRNAAYGFEIARRAEPRDWRYHFYAGQFWYAQAAESGQPGHAKLADRAFAAGMAANPLDPGSFLGRALTQLRYGSVVVPPAEPATLRAWAEQALIVAPASPAVRRQYSEIVRRLDSKR